MIRLFVPVTMVTLSVAFATLPTMASPLKIQAPGGAATADVSRLPQPDTSYTFITDIRGKHIRMIGQRFYPDPANALNIAGRDLPMTPGTELSSN